MNASGVFVYYLGCYGLNSFPLSTQTFQVSQVKATQVFG